MPYHCLYFGPATRCQLHDIWQKRPQLFPSGLRWPTPLSGSAVTAKMHQERSSSPSFGLFSCSLSWPKSWPLISSILWPNESLRSSGCDFSFLLFPELPFWPAHCLIPCWLAFYLHHGLVFLCHFPESQQCLLASAVLFPRAEVKRLARIICKLYLLLIQINLNALGCEYILAGSWDLFSCYFTAHNFGAWTTQHSWDSTRIPPAGL